tara:strand:+ start:476 stop:814 length:339 start_codon:yes stop_codon:yes gene_type:complete
MTKLLRYRDYPQAANRVTGPRWRRIAVYPDFQAASGGREAVAAACHLPQAGRAPTAEDTTKKRGQRCDRRRRFRRGRFKCLTFPWPAGAGVLSLGSKGGQTRMGGEFVVTFR